LLLCSGWCCSWASAQPTPEKKTGPTPAQKKELQAIVAEFRKPKMPVETRLELIERAAAIHTSGVEDLAAVVTKEMHKELAVYRQQFMKASAGAAATRVTPAAVMEITALRAKILDLTKRDDLSKEMIVEVSDPALARLKEIVLVDRNEVLAKSPELTKRRAALDTLGRQWEACAKHLIIKDQGEDLPSFESYLGKEEEIAAALALPMDPSTRQVLAANSAISARIDPEEARCILDLNLMRNLLGLPPLAIDLRLVACGRDHSKDMQEHNFFEHESPLPGKTEPWDRAKLFGTTASGENIYKGSTDGARANLAWWHSPGHHKNMLGAEHKRVGVGRTGVHWTELFGR
jgi:uncharacterized protein YkwD